MHPDWHRFLEDQGAGIGDHDTVTLGAATAAPDCALADLSSLGIIKVTGADRIDFLQGQLTNDIEALSPESSHLSALCNPKGRMIALFRVFLRDDAVYLQLPLERLALVMKRIGMYVLRSQVTLEDVSDALVRIGLAGDCISSLLPCELPPADNAVVQHGTLTLLRLPGDRPRVEIIGPCEDVMVIWNTAATTARPAGPEFWPLLDIRAGLPTVFDLTAEAFVPQMTNLQLIDGVSFTKGCYTGQEVVARMHYLGKLKRRMYRFDIDASEPPAPGAGIFRASGGDQSAGKVVDARVGPDGAVEGLVVVQIDEAERGDLRLGDAGGAPLELSDPPYPLTSQEAAD